MNCTARVHNLFQATKNIPDRVERANRRKEQIIIQRWEGRSPSFQISMPESLKELSEKARKNLKVRAFSFMDSKTQALITSVNQIRDGDTIICLSEEDERKMEDQ